MAQMTKLASDLAVFSPEWQSCSALLETTSDRQLRKLSSNVLKSLGSKLFTVGPAVRLTSVALDISFGFLHLDLLSPFLSHQLNGVLEHEDGVEDGDGGKP